MAVDADVYEALEKRAKKAHTPIRYQAHKILRNALKLKAAIVIPFLAAAFLAGGLVMAHAESKAEAKTAPAPPISDAKIAELSRLRNAFEDAHRQTESIKSPELRKAEEFETKAQQAYVVGIQKAQADAGVPATCYPSSNWLWVATSGPCVVTVKEEKKETEKK